MSIVAGFDLGGSHAACLVADEGGRVLGRGTGGPANLVNLGREPVLAAIRKALSEAARTVPGGAAAVGRCVIGGAGGGSPETARELAALAREAGLVCPVTVTHDAAAALAGALLLAPGVIVVAGTGSIAYGVDAAGNRARAGGRGPLLGDEGGGYWIGLRGLRAAIRSLDGREEAGALAARLARALRLPEPSALPGLAYAPARLGVAEVAGLAPAVLAAAGEGDPAAAGIVDEAAAELALLARAVVCRLADGACLPVTYGGGLFRAGEVILGPLRVHFARQLPGVQLRPPAGPPLLGAVLLALKELGDVDPEAAEWLRRELTP